MEPYDQEYMVIPFGLHNSGAVCYLNSLLQSLTSLPSFVKELFNNEYEFSSRKDTLGSQLVKLCRDFEVTPEFSNPSQDYRQTQITSVADILKEIQSIRKRDGHISTLHQGTQEDVFEGFKFLIESLDSGEPKEEVFLNNFAVRHRLTIHCNSCGEKHSAERNSSPEEIMVNMADRDPLLQKGLDTQESIQEYIKMHMLYPDDYRCEKCGVKNNLSEGSAIVKQFYTLARISSIVVLSFHHNHQVLWENSLSGAKKQRSVAWFPQEMQFMDKKKRILKYKVVAQIEQFGTLSSGHYVAKCLRPRPPGFGELRLKSARAALKETTQRLQTIKQINPNSDRANKLEEHVEYLIKTIKDEERRTASNDPFDKLGVFRFDDRKITYQMEGFVPSEFTYLVFYHLV